MNEWPNKDRMAKDLIHGSFLARKEIYTFHALNQSSFGGWSGKVQFSKKNYCNTLHWKKDFMDNKRTLNIF